MKLSLNWLSDFVDLSGISPEKVEDLLTLRTAESEGIEHIQRKLDHVVWAELLSLTRIDDRLQLVEVDIGGETRTTVSAAPGLSVGAIAAFALPGAVLADGTAIAATEFKGHASEGMLCAPGEIGVGSYREKVLFAPAGTPPGRAVAEDIASTDVLIEIDNKSLTHRPDLWGHYGFARELAGIFGLPLKAYPVVDLSQYDGLPAHPVAIDALDVCPLYSATAVDVRGDAVSPLKVQSRLLTLGQSPISLLVDLTNYIQLELGQPSHAFDARHVPAIRVARAGEARKFETLDGKVRDLIADDLLILGNDQPVALAGIIGGADSAVMDGTEQVVLEVANFAATRVRRTSVRLDVRTDSSLRFEKKLPLAFVRTAAGRFLQLLVDADIDHTVRSRFSYVGKLASDPRRIHVPAGWLSRRAGADISNEVASRLLESIGFTVTGAEDGGLHVDVPGFRGEADMAILEDVSEEVFRLFGYENITPVPPVGPLAPTPSHMPTVVQHRIRRLLAQAHGMVEVHTYSWFNNDWIHDLGYVPERPLKLANAYSATRDTMRDTLLPNMLAVAHQNRRAAERFQVFEIGRRFWLDAEGTKHEADQLCILAVDQTSDDPEPTYRAVRSAVDDILETAGLPALVPGNIGAPARTPWTVPGLTLSLVLNGQNIGYMGVLNDKSARRILRGGHAVWLTLDVDAVLGELFPGVDYQSPPSHPGTEQDFTFEWPMGVGYGGLCRVLDGFSHDAVHSRSLQAVYPLPDQPEARYTLRYALRWAGRTPSEVDIEAFRSAFLGFLDQNKLKLC